MSHVRRQAPSIGGVVYYTTSGGEESSGNGLVIQWISHYQKPPPSEVRR